MPKQLKILGESVWDEDKEEFVKTSKDYTILIEHSLISVSKWESIYHKPFLASEKDYDMVKTYIKCMSINSVPDEVYDRITPENINEVTEYIEDPQTATWFSDKLGAHSKGRMSGSGEVITAEIVYCWMTQMNIPVQFEKWHLNRLLTLIRVISIKNDPKGSTTKMSPSERRALNKARQAKYHTRG